MAAISYDSLPILERFAKRKEISFLLLSDPGSKTIDAYGIRNREATGSRLAGIPYPGTFLVDSKGIIRAKLFYDSYKKRHDSAELIEAAKKFD